MKPDIFILATCRKPELLPFTTLVFGTLRVGFPTLPVTVFGNMLEGDSLTVMNVICLDKGYEFQPTNTIHHEWIERLCLTRENPFYVIDTDVIFYENCEGWTFDKPLAGWRIPEWNDDFSGAVTRSRLHGSFLYIDPVKVREAVLNYKKSFPDSPFVPLANLIYPLCLPFNGRGYFYDTCAILYHAIGGQSFTDKQLDSYFHFNFGTISDVVLPRLKHGEEMKKAREFIMQNKQAGRGQWRQQMEYYAAKQS